MLALADVKERHMKKLALVFGVALASCHPDNKAVEVKPEITVQAQMAGTSMSLIIVKLKGHDYVIMDGYKQGGICHAESCLCRSK
jgi:uncharacterized lipoprotein YajG